MFTSGFIGPQILNFERSLSLSSRRQSSLVPPCIIPLSLESAYLQVRMMDRQPALLCPTPFTKCWSLNTII